MTSSFTALALAPGVLKTGMPRVVIFGMGMLLTPAPARPTALSRLWDRQVVHFEERSRIASGSGILSDTWKRSAGSRASPSGECCCSVRILNMIENRPNRLGS